MAFLVRQHPAGSLSAKYPLVVCPACFTNWTAIWLSIRLASATTLVLLALGIPLAYWIVFSPRRWKFLVEAIVALHETRCIPQSLKGEEIGECALQVRLRPSRKRKCDTDTHR